VLWVLQFQEDRDVHSHATVVVSRATSAAVARGRRTQETRVVYPARNPDITPNA